MNNHYVILDTVNVPRYNTLSNLYKKLKSLKKEVYADNERIVIIYCTQLPKTRRLLDELLVAVDIPEYFVIFEPTEEIYPDSLDFEFSESFCIYPWNNFEIRNRGEFKPCCKYQGGVVDKNNIPMSIANYSITDAYTSEYMNNLRNAFRQGHRPSECSDCWINEAAGKDSSLRQRGKWKFKDIYYTLDYSKDDISNIRSLDLKLGNACNLTCRICNPNASSKIASIEFNADRLSKTEYKQIQSDVKWATTDDFWAQFLPIAHNLIELDILGGEPLLVKPHYTFLEKLVEIDVAKNIQLDYTSNGTIFSEKFIKIWKNFKEVKISFSIDDTGKRFEYQRNGACWDEVNDNIKKYISLKSDKLLIEVYPTINLQNVYYLPELLDWIENINFDFVSYSFLHSPKFLSIENLTSEAKNLVINKLFPHVNRHPMISSAVNMINQSVSCNDVSDFINYMTNLDQERNQNFLLHHYEIAKAMGYSRKG